MKLKRTRARNDFRIDLALKSYRIQPEIGQSEIVTVKRKGESNKFRIETSLKSNDTQVKTIQEFHSEII